MRPGVYDFAVPRGGSGALAIRLKVTDAAGARTAMDLAGSAFVLSMAWPGGALRKASTDGGLVVDVGAATVTWRPTPAEARSVPGGRIARYEWEQRGPGGAQTVLLEGYLIGVGGLNND